MVIGGTGLSGPHLVADLVDRGCEVVVVHRGVHERPLPAGVRHIHVDDNDTIRVRRSHVEEVRPDAIVHMVAITAEDARLLFESSADLVDRMVVVSSIDVYRAYGRHHRTEPGEPDPVIPLAEEAPLRARHGPEGDTHEKLDVEREVMTAGAAAGTVVRYPAVYGPGDRRRVTHYVRRMMDERPFILLDEAMSPWRFSRGFSRNVAAAVALATVSPEAAGEIYNVAETSAYSEREWVEAIAARVGWSGSIVEAPGHLLPVALRQDLDFRQHWVVDYSKVRGDLGYNEPTPPETALTATVNWELAHPLAGLSIDYAAEDDIAASL